MYRFRLVLLILLSLACSKKALNTQDADDDSMALALESAVSSTDNAANESEQTADANTCSLSRFTPAIGSASCAGTLNDKTVLSQFDNCYADVYILKGLVTLDFDSPATCSEWVNGGLLPSSGSVIRTMDSFNRINPNGSFISTNSNSHVNYKGESVSGGVKTVFSNGSRAFEILGLHRTRTRANGKEGFDHSVRTLAPIVVSGLKVLGTREIQSGKIRVDHNRAKYTADFEFKNLRWSSSCCHPTSGQIVLSQSGSLQNEFTVEFNSQCGQIQITDQNGSSQSFELQACE